MFRTLRWATRLFSLARAIILPTLVTATQHLTTPRKVKMDSSNPNDKQNQLLTFPICKEDFIQQGQVYTFRLPLNADGKQFQVILVKYQGKSYCLSSICPYDRKSYLSDALCIGNKLCCLEHGCSFNITNGHVENGPAMLNLAIFPVFVNEGIINIYLPQKPPLFMRPFFYRRNFNDLRKVLIIGGGIGAVGVIQGLRTLGYLGQISLVNDKNNIPYSKDQVALDFKGEMKQIHSRNWYDQMDVNYYPSLKVQQVFNKFGSPFVRCQNGLELEYDALVLATGSKPAIHHKSLQQIIENIHTIQSRVGFKRFKLILPKIKSLTIMGLTPKTFQIINTLKSQFPLIDLQVCDVSRHPQAELIFGKLLFTQLIQQARKNGVSFYLEPQIFSAQIEDNKTVLTCNKGMTIQADAILLAGQKRYTQLNQILEKQKKHRVQLSDQLKIIGDIQCRTAHKRIFAVGEGTQIKYFPNSKHLQLSSDAQCYESGFVAACNIMALSVPFHFVPYNKLQLFNKRVYYIGAPQKYPPTSSVKLGNQKEWIILNFFQNRFYSASGTYEKRRQLRLLLQALRFSLYQQIILLRDGQLNFIDLQNILRKSKRVGCFKDEIQKVSDLPFRQDIVWLRRSVNKSQPFEQRKEFQQHSRMAKNILEKDQ